MLRPLAVIFGVISATSAFATAPLDTSNQMIISIRDQKLVLLALQENGRIMTNDYNLNKVAGLRGVSGGGRAGAGGRRGRG